MTMGLTTIKEFLRTHWNISGNLKRLAGFEDINYRLTLKEAVYLVKISVGAYHQELDLQMKAINYATVGAVDSPLQLSSIVKTLDGEDYLPMREDGQDYCIRVYSWLPGITFADHRPKSKEILEDLGYKAGLHLNLLNGFSHPAQKRKNFKWDLANALWIKEHLPKLSLDVKDIVSSFLQQFENLGNHYAQLPKSIIHNDLNDYNILVEGQKISGFIDYGDLTYTQIINELAILITYAVLEKPDPLRAANAIVRGFHKSHPLHEDELLCLHTLVGIRLSISLTTSTLNKIDNPENEYLQISDGPARNLIQKWNTIHPKLAYYHFRAACGMEPCPHHKNFQNWTANPENKWANVTTLDENKKDYIVLDLGVGSKELGHENVYNNAYQHHNCVNELKFKKGRTFAIGKYDEVRPLYSSEEFTTIGNSGRSWRTLHIGLDFFNEAGTEVFAFTNGEVHALQYNEGDKNYGNTIILKHDFEELTFYTLYGHLSSTSITHLMVGQQISKGERIGWYGNPVENGNWAPHLHFQIILDMVGNEGDFPGVAFFEDRAVFLSLSPDPAPLFNIHWEKPARYSKEEIVEKRKLLLGRSYSISYAQPLHIERAYMQHLYDESGRKFLDCVNNVPHVGHQNWEVIRAATEQMALLNTNTRYLHENIIRLAEKLVKTLPPHLKVCHFVNSGSEANELAIRMARTYTGKRDVVVMENGYHGNTNLCVDISSYKFDGKGGSGKPDFVHKIKMPDPVRGERDAEGTYLAQREVTFLDQQLNSSAAFIAESILSCGGQVVLPEGYLSTLYSHFKERNMVLIADEVQTGLGRTGSDFWAFQNENILPDIVTIGKPLGNGHPVAAVVCTEEIADAFANGMEYFNTFGGNPVSCVIAETVLDILHADNLQLRSLEIGNFIKESIKQLSHQYKIISDVRGRGYFLGWEYTLDESGTPAAGQAKYFVDSMKEKGVLLSTDGPFHNVIKFKPPMYFNKKDAQYLLECMESVLNENMMKY